MSLPLMRGSDVPYFLIESNAPGNSTKFTRSPKLSATFLTMSYMLGPTGQAKLLAAKSGLNEVAISKRLYNDAYTDFKRN